MSYVMPYDDLHDRYWKAMKATERVREIHKPKFSEDEEVEVCEYCFELYGCPCCSYFPVRDEFYWPCRTIRALDGGEDVR